MPINLKRRQLYIPKCYICNGPICKQCDTLGFCPDHWKNLTENEKARVKKLRIMSLVINIIILIVIIIGYSYWVLNAVKSYIPENWYNIIEWEYIAGLFIAFGVTTIIYAVLFIGFWFRDKILPVFLSDGSL